MRIWRFYRWNPSEYCPKAPLTERLIDKKGLGRNPQVALEAANDEERVKTLKNCSQHGTFRGEMCPVCDDEGKGCG